MLLPASTVWQISRFYSEARFKFPPLAQRLRKGRRRRPFLTHLLHAAAGTERASLRDSDSDDFYGTAAEAPDEPKTFCCTQTLPQPRNQEHRTVWLALHEHCRARFIWETEP